VKVGAVTSGLEPRREEIRPGDSNEGPSYFSDEQAATISYVPSIFHARPSFTNAGDYDIVIKLPTPILPPHKAVKGTTEKYKGKILALFPDLKITEEDIKNLDRKRDATDPEST